jgi:hypothetical protein
MGPCRDGDVDLLAARFGLAAARASAARGQGCSVEFSVSKNSVNSHPSAFPLSPISYADNTFWWHESDGARPPSFTRRTIDNTAVRTRGAFCVHGIDMDR